MHDATSNVEPQLRCHGGGGQGQEVRDGLPEVCQIRFSLIRCVSPRLGWDMHHHQPAPTPDLATMYRYARTPHRRLPFLSVRTPREVLNSHIASDDLNHST